MGKVKSVSKLLSLKKPTPPKKQSKPKKFDSTSTVQKFEPSWTGKEIDRKHFTVDRPGMPGYRTIHRSGSSADMPKHRKAMRGSGMFPKKGFQKKIPK